MTTPIAVDDDPDVAVDVELPYGEYVKLLFRHGELFSGAGHSAAMHAEVATKVFRKATEALEVRKYDVAFAMCARCTHIIDKATLLKRKAELERVPSAPGVLEVRKSLTGAMDMMEMLQTDTDKLPRLYARLMAKVQRESASRLATIRLQMVQEQSDEEAQLRLEHEARRAQVLAKHSSSSSTTNPNSSGFALPGFAAALAAGTAATGLATAAAAGGVSSIGSAPAPTAGGMAIQMGDPAGILPPDVFHAQSKTLLLQAEQQRLDALQARLKGSSGPLQGGTTTNLPHQPSPPPATATPAATAGGGPSATGTSSTTPALPHGLGVPAAALAAAGGPANSSAWVPSGTTTAVAPMGPAADLLRHNHLPVKPQATAAAAAVPPVIPALPQLPPAPLPAASRPSTASSPSRLLLRAPTAAEIATRTQQWAYDFASQPPGQPRRGMVNLGNTCYLNSVCQVLSQTLLARYFLSDEYIASIVNRFDGGGKIANTFAYVMRELAASGVTYPVSPSPFKSAMGRVYDSFAGGGQQDANEFLRCLLDGIHEDLNEKSGAKPPPVDIDNTKGSDTELAKLYWHEYAKRNASIVSTLFAFQERSVIECPNCGRCTRSFSAAMGVELPIPMLPTARPVSIEDCLAQYCTVEVLDSKSLYRCSGCRLDVRASKQLAFYSLPEVLVLSVKRFRSYGNFSDKVNQAVVFQPTLEMAPFTVGAISVGGASSSSYRLIGVVNHQGNMHGGHYTAEALGILDKHWAYYSDEVARPGQRPDFKLAYMMVYAKVAARR